MKEAAGRGVGERAAETLPRAATAPPRAVPLLAALAALLVALYSQWPALDERYVINNDAAQHTAWMARLADPSLLADDPISDYAAAYQGWGPALIYRAAVRLTGLSPLAVGKGLPLLLSAVAAFFLCRIGWWIGDRWPGDGWPGDGWPGDGWPGDRWPGDRRPGDLWRGGAAPLVALLAVAWWLTTPIFLHKMAGGHARAFALPLLAFFLDALLRRSPPALAVSGALCALFYPMAFLLAAGTAALGSWRRSRLALGRRALLGLLAGLLAGGGLLAVERLLLDEREHGPIVTRDQLVGRPEFGRRGQFEILPTPPYPELAADEVRQAAAPLPPAALAPGRLAAERYRRLSAAVAGLLLIGLLWGTVRGWLPPELAALVASGALLYLIADRLMLLLFLPARYAQYSLRLAVPLVGAALLARLILLLPAGWPRRSAAALVLAAMAWNLPALAGAGLEDRSASRPVAEFLAGQPPDVLVAAHPYLADDIPLFARRRVLVDFEHSHPYYPGWWRWVEERTAAFFDAYYARRLSEVCAFMERWEVDYLLVDRGHYRADYLARGKAVYFEPFRGRIRELTAAGGPYALADPPPAAAVFAAGDRYLATPDSLGCQRADAPSRPPSAPGRPSVR